MPIFLINPLCDSYGYSGSIPVSDRLSSKFITLLCSNCLYVASLTNSSLCSYISIKFIVLPNSLSQFSISAPSLTTHIPSLRASFSIPPSLASSWVMKPRACPVNPSNIHVTNNNACELEASNRDLHAIHRRPVQSRRDYLPKKL